MRTIEGKLVEYGVDWITASALTKQSQAKLQTLGNTLLRSEQSAGNDLKRWGFAGYDGFKCGSVQIGTRSDSTCIRLGSVVAFENWLRVYHAADNFTRLDLQTTIRTKENPQLAIRRSYRSALRHSAKRKRGPQVTVLHCNNGSSTLYLGHRQSERFGRIYDKGRESKLDYYQNCLRAEQEIKGALVLPTLREMAQSHRPVYWAACEVWRFAGARGVSLPEPSASVRAISARRKRSDRERQLAWLRNQVRPTVQALIDDGCYPLVAESLGIYGPTKARGKQSPLVAVGATKRR